MEEEEREREREAERVPSYGVYGVYGIYIYVLSTPSIFVEGRDSSVGRASD